MIGVYGGAFDPVHIAHLRVAIEARESLNLQEVRLVPTGEPPHRDGASASAEQRLDMLSLATDGVQGLMVDDREIRRDGPSYTVDTLRELRVELRSPLCLIMGADAFASVQSWRSWRELFELAHIAVFNRPGVDVEAIADNAELAALAFQGDGERAPGSWSALRMTPLAISSSDLRSRRRTGGSIRYLVADEVNRYIRAANLYLT